MSKHHAPEEEASASEMSWILGLAKPAEAAPDSTLPFYRALVPKPPRHARDADVSSEEAPAVAQTGPIRRISAAQVDTLIGRLDGLTDQTDDAPTDNDPSDNAPSDNAPTDDAASDDAPAEGAATHDAPAAGTATGETYAATDETEAAPGETEATPDHIADQTASDGHILPRTDDGSSDGDDEVVEPAAEPSQTNGISTGPVAQRSLTRPARAQLRKPVLVGAAAVLCLLTVGGGTVTAMEKTVSIVVDGKVQKISTLSGSVAGALASAGLTASSHDAVAPAVDASIADGSTIVLQRGRLMTVTVDGEQRQIWTTARDSRGVAAELGSRSSADLALAANRSRAIPLVAEPGPFAAAPRTSETIRTVSVSVAGRPAVQSTTAATTVGALLTALDIGFGPYDTVSPAAGTKLRNGLVIRVNRVRVTTTSTTSTLAEPAAASVQDDTIVKGTSTVVQQAKPGRELVSYTVTTINGRQVSKVVSGRKTLVKAVGQITHVGTRTSFTYSGSEVFTNDTEFGVNWDGLAMCESTHNPKAINANPSAGLPTYGMFQFDLPTWESVGGSGNPIDASPEEQLMRAKLLFQSRGLEPWACRDAAH